MKMKICPLLRPLQLLRARSAASSRASSKAARRRHVKMLSTRRRPRCQPAIVSSRSRPCARQAKRPRSKKMVFVRIREAQFLSNFFFLFGEKVIGNTKTAYKMSSNATGALQSTTSATSHNSNKNNNKKKRSSTTSAATSSSSKAKKEAKRAAKRERKAREAQAKKESKMSKKELRAKMQLIVGESDEIIERLQAELEHVKTQWR